jgi:predicted O-methyltransferase YrrM
MSQEPDPRDVDAFLDSTVVGDDPALSAALEASNAAGLPPIAVSAQQGKFLCLLAGAMRARRILEIGTLGGFSTIWLARGAGPEGQVVTLEYQSKYAEVARANLAQAGVGDRVEVVVGAALDTLPTLTGGPFDLVFIDADKHNSVAYLDWSIRLTRPGSVIVMDNVIRQGQILAPTEDDHRRQDGGGGASQMMTDDEAVAYLREQRARLTPVELAEFLDRLLDRVVRQTVQVMGEHPRLDTAVLQTVGVKGWDGFALALVK